jgi:hypothetical protein
MVLQAWGNPKGKGDIRVAAELCKLLSDVEGDYRTDCMFLLVYGKLTPSEMVDLCLRNLHEKFRAEGCEARNFGVGMGHPYGSNMLFSAAQTEVAGRVRDRRAFPYSGVLFMESDIVPMRKDWISALCREWNTRVIAEGEWTDEEENPQLHRMSGWPRYECMGHFHQAHDPANAHVNGNMIQRPDILVRHPYLTKFTADFGWDLVNRKEYMRMSRDTDLICQHYHKPFLKRQEIPYILKNGVVPAILHGLQGQAGVDARKFMREILVEGVPA